MDTLPDGSQPEYIIRTNDRPVYWPVCTWDGASGRDVARTPDGARWFIADYSGWNGPRKWSEIKTPEVQPALRRQAWPRT